MRNILIIRFSSLGDLVTLEPTFRTIREFFKNDNLVFLTSGIGKGIYQDSDYFDEYIIHNSVLSSVKILKKYDFDLIYNLQCTRPSHYISLCLSKNKQINSSRNLFQKMFNLKVTSKKLRELIELSNYFEVSKIDEYFRIFDSDINLICKSDKEFVKKIKNQRYIAISTGTSERWISKKWGIDNYINLIKELVKKDFKIILIGGKLELSDQDKILSQFNNNEIISYVNKTNLTELKNLLNEVDIYIGNDSGPAHIAAGTGTSTITIFGSTDKKHSPVFLPYKGVHEYITPDSSVKCHPCYKTKCPTNIECMASISTTEVLNKVESILKELNK